MKLAVPSYFYPGDSRPEVSWDRMIAAKPAIVVINPSSGPGAVADANYKEVIRKCRKAEVLVQGYIATTWGDKPIEDAKEEKFAYRALYGIKDLFFDEVSTDAGKVNYYQRLATPKSALNPGTIPDRGYKALKMTMMNYETDMATYLAKPPPPEWVLNVSPRLFWHCVSNVPDVAAVKEVLAVAKSRNAGYVWITDDVENNPYDSLPPFYEELAALCRE